MHKETELEELFPAGRVGGAAKKHFSIVRRNGTLLLALPKNFAEAAVGLDLYPAQRRSARFLKRILKAMARARIPLPLGSGECDMFGHEAFAQFLTKLTPDWAHPQRGLAIFAGNPRAPGRRFILLLFSSGIPIAVVKAGATPAAVELVRREAAFLAEARRDQVAAPLEVFDSAKLSALALPFLPGAAPRQAEIGEVAALLDSWLHDDAPVSISELPAWERLRVQAKEFSLFPKLASAIGSHQIQSALTHGDFAPWNIRVHPQSKAWQVFDWERGELRGIPGWDWLHFEIQPLILVERRPVEEIIARVEGLFRSREFHAYAEKSWIAGIERPLALAYLLHCHAVQRQTEGAREIEALLQLTEKQWTV